MLASRPRFGVASALGLALALFAPKTGRAQSPESEAGSGEVILEQSVRALWSDGDQLLLAGSNRSLYRIGRQGEPTREAVDIEVFVDADGTRAVGGQQAVFIAADGAMVRWTAQGIETDQVPLLEGDEIVAVAVDASGVVYAIGRERALYLRGSLRWRAYPYPENVHPLGAATSPGGQVYVVGRDGMMVRFDDGQWDRPLLPGLSPETLRAPWYEAWYSGVTQTLWIRAGRDRLLEVEMGEQRSDPEPQEQSLELGKRSKKPKPDAAQGEEGEEGEPPVEGPKINLRLSGSVPTREHPIPVGPPAEGEPPAGFTAITGVSVAAGDRVITSAGGQLWLFERERFVPIANDVGLVHDIVLDEGEDLAWVASQRDLRSYQLRAIGESTNDEPLHDSDRRLLDRLLRREQWHERNADLPQIFWMPTARIDNGVVFPLGADPVAGYSLEVGAGALLAPLAKDRGPTLWVWPELAYRFETHPIRGGHLFDVGVGLGFGTHLIAGFYRPRLVLGGIDQGLEDGEPGVYGLRHGLALEALWGIVGLEFSHQYLGSNRGSLTDLRLGLSINLAPLIWGAILWATLPTSD
ncbi:hypothetical protein G6O69_04965 [Pseudenhygromyxa sp. WMMC2535]|uniref:hypothetical protein n=1 Tax=Pseudenhygromyxa sp. WMMC2535 TaxID=2712867 RepID=UPI001555DAAE|nr:hypothetical protein [Pseudenhygromyxa sp. WMMC2535]NVB37171.1 hypothetical protein [Pseudenhygromyxa sp. WMMC2535]